MFAMSVVTVNVIKIPVHVRVVTQRPLGSYFAKRSHIKNNTTRITRERARHTSILLYITRYEYLE